MSAAMFIFYVVAHAAYLRKSDKKWDFYDQEWDTPECNCGAHCIVEPRTRDEQDGNINRKCATSPDSGLMPDATCIRINDPIIFPVKKLIERFCFYECQPQGLLVTAEKVKIDQTDLTGYHGGTLRNTPCSSIELATGSDGNGSDLSVQPPT
eukprot:GEMP01079268.1.p1 GENE.GEMP01079268.1~~GEMP01079268.1.p1  ORF type:complete len:152 (+),score=33.77 GEMP01079268.1:164-619(+)